jgi:predicted nuclease of predicted toxin-antitoxin system
MKFLIDQDVYAVTTKFLIDAGHDVIVVAQMGLAQASDEEILRPCRKFRAIALPSILNCYNDNQPKIST